MIGYPHRYNRDTKYNRLRTAIREAMNTAKLEEWSCDPSVCAAASAVWHDLDQIFHKLGPFPVEEDQ